MSSEKQREERAEEQTAARNRDGSRPAALFSRRLLSSPPLSPLDFRRAAVGENAHFCSDFRRFRPHFGAFGHKSVGSGGGGNYPLDFNGFHSKSTFELQEFHTVSLFQSFPRFCHRSFVVLLRILSPNGSKNDDEFPDSRHVSSAGRASTQQRAVGRAGRDGGPLLDFIRSCFQLTPQQLTQHSCAMSNCIVVGPFNCRSTSFRWRVDGLLAAWTATGECALKADGEAGNSWASALFPVDEDRFFLSAHQRFRAGDFDGLRFLLNALDDGATLLRTAADEQTRRFQFSFETADYVNIYQHREFRPSFHLFIDQLPNCSVLARNPLRPERRPVRRLARGGRRVRLPHGPPAALRRRRPLVADARTAARHSVGAGGGRLDRRADVLPCARHRRDEGEAEGAHDQTTPARRPSLQAAREDGEDQGRARGRPLRVRGHSAERGRALR